MISNTLIGHKLIKQFKKQQQHISLWCSSHIPDKSHRNLDNLKLNAQINPWRYFKMTAEFQYSSCL